MSDEITGSDFAVAADPSGETTADSASQPTDFSDGSDSSDASPRAAPEFGSERGQEPAQTDGLRSRGPIPFDRHQSILTNTRETARKQTLEQVRSQYGPHLQLGHAFLEDPIAFVQAVMQHPSYAHAFQAQGRPPQQDDADVRPELVSDTGIPAFSAPQVSRIVAREVQKAREALEGRLSPIEQRFAHADLTSRATSAAQGIISELAGTYGDDWASMKREVANVMAQDRRLKPETAAQRVWRQKILPTIRGREREAVVTGLRGKANATTERPSGSTNGRMRSDADKTWQEVFQEEARRIGMR